MTILLVRHGETTGNAARMMQRPDVPLNARGIRQAAALADRLVGHGFAHILCSDLPRARMTAEPLVARGHSIEHTPLLQERNFGDIRGMRYDDLTFDPFAPSYAPPNGETVEMFLARVARAFDLILERRRALSGPLVVVTHGLVCHALVRDHLRIADAPARFDNTGVTVFDAAPPHPMTLINCTRHLGDELTTPPVNAPV
jgi:probable phosphoglycerate mutase